MEDVIVVGAGPAGTTAAKRCAEHGLKTLILEKSRLPRDKVCSGMIMGAVAQTLMTQEFGEIPRNVLSQPAQLNGYVFHTPGTGRQKLDSPFPITWRRDLDYWMNQAAQSKGAEIWQGARVTNLRQEEQRFLVETDRDGESQSLEARFIVGGDGATSIVRSFLFPELEIRYAQVYQEHYRQEVDLDKDYFHWFYPVEYSPSSFTIHHKGGYLIVDVTARPGQVKQFMEWVKGFLAREHHFDSGQEPAWKGGCVEPALYKGLTSRTFLPAKGNALLVGDAAGLLMPVSGEGIGCGLRSGLLAASSIIKAMESGEQADKIYLEEFKAIISRFEELVPWFKRVVEATKAGGHSLPLVLREAYADTLRTF